MLGYVRRQWRSYVQHVLAAGHRFRPAGIVLKIGDHEGQATIRFGAPLLQHGTHVALAFHAAHGGAHLMACGKQLQDAMAADEA